jgi:hypothetical protein
LADALRRNINQRKSQQQARQAEIPLNRDEAPKGPDGPSEIENKT